MRLDAAVIIARFRGAGSHAAPCTKVRKGLACGSREIGAVISRERGRLFHGIAGSHFAVAGRLIDGFMESGLRAEVKGFRSFSAHAFA